MNEIETAVIGRELLENASQDLVDYAVGFAWIDEKNDIEDAMIGGSGTLVLVEGRHAILTADHVLDELPDTGITMPPESPRKRTSSFSEKWPRAIEPWQPRH